jgi:hypothetical protein
MKTLSVHLPSTVPLLHEADVLVIGGGPGGIGAAVAAAREGARTLLVEHYGFLGGMASAGEVNPFMSNHASGESLDKGIFEEWLSRMQTYGSPKGSRTFDPLHARLAAEDLCKEAGVELLFHHRVAHVESQGRLIQGVVLHSKSGLTGAAAKIYLDSTGDGDLAALSGCDFEYGHPGSTFVQPMTLCFKLRLSPEAVAAHGEPFTNENRALIQKTYLSAKAENRLVDCPREDVLYFRAVAADVVHFNSTRVVKKSPINGADLSAAEFEARRQMRALADLLRAEVPCFKGSEFFSIGAQIGVRESRRVKGLAYVTRADVEKHAKYADGIARVNYPIDIHSPTGAGTELVHLPKDAWYEIPYGCLVPKDRDNLLMACRAISVDHAVHSSVRVMPPVVSLGQAAGTAAALCLKQSCAPKDLDGKDVKQALIARGRNLVWDPKEPRFPEAGEKSTLAAKDKATAKVFNA